MKELLFAWITKGQYNISFLDGVIANIEIFVGLFIILFSYYFIKDITEKIKEKKNGNSNNK